MSSGEQGSTAAVRGRVEVRRCDEPVAVRDPVLGEFEAWRVAEVATASADGARTRWEVVTPDGEGFAVIVELHAPTERSEAEPVALGKGFAGVALRVPPGEPAGTGEGAREAPR